MGAFGRQSGELFACVGNGNLAAFQILELETLSGKNLVGRRDINFSGRIFIRGRKKKLHYIDGKEGHTGKEACPHKAIGQKLPSADIFFFHQGHFVFEAAARILITETLIPMEYWCLKKYQLLLFFRQHKDARQQPCNGRGEFGQF